MLIIKSGKFSLPKRSELSKELEQDDLVIIDVTEITIERPKSLYNFELNIV